MKTGDTILIQILALQDAIWHPFRRRDWLPPMPTVLYEHRKRFREGEGVSWATGGGRADLRKARQRELDALAETGLIELCGRQRRSGVRLPEPVEIATRALCGLPNIEAGYVSLLEVIRLEAGDQRPGPLCSELWLAGIDNYTQDEKCFRELRLVELLMLPALSRGWVESHSDLLGCVWYFATPKGREVAKQPGPTLPAGLPEWDRAAGRLYDKELIAARERLRREKPDRPNELGHCPLSASLNLSRPCESEE